MARHGCTLASRVSSACLLGPCAKFAGAIVYYSNHIPGAAAPFSGCGNLALPRQSTKVDEIIAKDQSNRDRRRARSITFLYGFVKLQRAAAAAAAAAAALWTIRDAYAG